jgi:hypothetical protein
MDLLVHISDPIDRDEMVPPAGFRIVLAQYDAVGGLQVVDGTNVVAVQAHNFHVLLNVQTFEHVSLHSLPTENAQPGKRLPDAFGPGLLPALRVDWSRGAGRN